MRAWLDTEFTDFIDCQLISIVIVTEDHRELYAERTDFDRNACSAFVHEAVIPRLGTEPAFVETEEQVLGALMSWLEQTGPLEIYCDYSDDRNLLLDLCPALPTNVVGFTGTFDD
jgi:hypothetical protein